MGGFFSWFKNAFWLNDNKPDLTHKDKHKKEMPI